MTDTTCWSVHVPDGVCLRRSYNGGTHHTFQVGRILRFWGDQFVPSFILQACHQVTTIWYDVKSADGNPLSTTQILFAPHVAGLNAFVFPISFFTAPAPGPHVFISTVRLAHIPYCATEEVTIPSWAVNAQRPQSRTTTGSIPPPPPSGIHLPIG